MVYVYISLNMCENIFFRTEKVYIYISKLVLICVDKCIYDSIIILLFLIIIWCIYEEGTVQAIRWNLRVEGLWD